MYLRPGNLLKDYYIQRKSSTVLSSRGRAKEEYDPNMEHLKAIKTSASFDQVNKWNQYNFKITHVISHSGAPKANVEDILVRNNRLYEIKAVDNPGELGVCTLYYCEERSK